ncbi:hypothetical protein IFM89_020510 [Coptis chinensis]|uniref:SHSP domain-containing protein n=1 Tax=Coptis chinensis TaxID=261450 RepID=A0A835HNG8_9MAGN|nr:hypothetical protein IFM89_020510 [Coptis chinensis]
MELELGLKITKTKDDLTTTDLRIAKDHSGILFLSREDENMFVLTAHLKGFKRKKIKINISKDKSQISISGEKPVQEMVMKRWIMHKKEVELKGFKKVFRIPNNVNVDKIQAKFNKEDTILSIFMPKASKGIQGIKIEEVIEGESSQTNPVQANEVQETIQPEIRDVVEETTLKKLPETEYEEAKETVSPTDVIEVPETIAKDQVEQVTEPEPEQVLEAQEEEDSSLPEQMKNEENIEEPVKVEEDQELQHPKPLLEDQVKEIRNEDIQKEEEAIKEQVKEESENLPTHIPEPEDQLKEERAEDRQEESFKDEENGREENKKEERRFCGPCIFAGSAFIGFLIVLVIQLIRSSNKSKK